MQSEATETVSMQPGTRGEGGQEGGEDPRGARSSILTQGSECWLTNWTFTSQNLDGVAHLQFSDP